MAHDSHGEYRTATESMDGVRFAVASDDGIEKRGRKPITAPAPPLPKAPPEPTPATNPPSPSQG